MLLLPRRYTASTATLSLFGGVVWCFVLLGQIGFGFVFGQSVLVPPLLLFGAVRFCCGCGLVWSKAIRWVPVPPLFHYLPGVHQSHDE